MKVNDILKKTLLFISETLFPADNFTKKLEKMTVEEFSQSARSLLTSREMKGVTILFEYHDPLVHRAIKALKFKGNEIIGNLLAKVIYEHIMLELGDKIQLENFETPILVPMPSSSERMLERGWNQCEIICKALSEIDSGINFKLNTSLLRKNRFTESQVGKTRAERLENLAGSFSVRDKKGVSGQNIILFDDVVTTGATMSEAKKTLLESGARKVWCVAIAH